MTDPDDTAYRTSYLPMSDTQLLRIVTADLDPALLNCRHLTEIVRSASGWILVLEPDLLALSRRRR